MRGAALHGSFAVGVFVAGVASAAAQELEQPITGRAVSCANGKVHGFDCDNVELLSYLPATALGASELRSTDVWGWTDSTTGREFAIIGLVDATAFVEVTDPVNPKYLGQLLLHPGASSNTIGVKVYKNHAFIVAEGTDNGMQVFDLTQLRDVKNAPATFEETAHYDKVTNVHTLTMNEATGFAYPVAVRMGGEMCGGGLHMVDVRTPTKPIFAGCHHNPSVGRGYVHDTHCVIYRGPDADYKGRELCLNSGEAAVEIVDVTDKKNPKTISVATYPSASYTHQGWFTEDMRYFFLDDELDDGVGEGKTRTIVFDLNDLDDPVVLTEFYGTTDATDHNLYIRGRYMYQSNYTAGLRIIDINDPKSPKEVGFLDTAPDVDGPGMELGSWGNYPYFKNNVVAVSNNGLFLVRLLGAK